MSAKTDNVREALANQLSELDESLGATADEAAMLSDLKSQIKQLLSSGGAAEGDVRALLQERFDRGDLRNETLQLVKAVLDRFASEQLPTDQVPSNDGGPQLTSAPNSDAMQEDDVFASTTIIAQQLVQPTNIEQRIQAGSILRDRFLLKRRVTGGSMGVVYQALDRRLDEGGEESPLVAIKVLSPKLSKNPAAVRALQQEAAKGRCLVHPNIVRFVDLDRDDDLYFIVMEWLEGSTLADILDAPESRVIDVDRALAIIRQVGQALDYAHRCGIVHADVKPGNIMIQPDGTAKLFDFGVARVRQAQKHPDDLDPHAIGAVTPAYSSVEVLEGEEPVPSDDVFSLGCLLYRLVAGYRVFGPRNAAEAAEDGMQPQRIESLSDAQWHALRKAIALSRADRFAGMDEFIDALGSDKAIRATNHERLVDAPRGQGGRFGWGLLLGAIVLAAGAYVYLGEMTGPDTPATVATTTSAVEAGTASREEQESDPATDSVVPEASAAIRQSALTRQDAGGPLPEPERAPTIDYSELPPADYELSLSSSSESAPRIVVTLREDADAVTIDLKRGDLADRPVRLKIEEIRHSGNRSPWAARQYSIADADTLEIPAGQDRGRITMAMASDPLREADQQSTLRVRLADIASSELGLLEVVLEDDDQRAFEANLPANTVAFAVSQVAVSERDPAVQIDILRFNPDSQPLTIDYRLQSVTATEGEDYFAAGNRTLRFAAGQRSARVLVPLVQDSSVEGDEAFAVELLTPDAEAGQGVYRRLMVIIRDDEIAGP